VIRATPWPFYTREEPGTHHAGGWLGLGAVLAEQQKPRHQQNSIPGQSIPKPIAIPTELSRPPFNTRTETNFLFIYLCHFFGGQEQHSDSLRTERSEDRIPLGMRFSVHVHPSRLTVGPTQPSVQ